MRFFGQQFRWESSSAVRTASVSRATTAGNAEYAAGHAARASRALFLVLAAALLTLPGRAQTAPYVLPYTMSTYAGPHAAYTAGAPCATNSNLVALNAAGDGCPAASVSVGSDPHDVRVDSRGNVFYIDNGSPILIHKISPQTGQQTVYTGNRICSSGDTYGDGCPANDGAANNNTAISPASDKLKAQRGLAIAANGDLYMAGYNDYEIHRISAATGLMSLVAGTGSSNTTTFSGSSALTTGIGSTRGVGVDAAGNVYIADTANNILQEVPASGAQAGQLLALTAPNAAGTKSVTSGVPAASALLSAPEDVQIDANGNIYIADFGNNVVRAIYSGRGTLPGIFNPVAGYIYTVAGGVVLATGATNTTYPSDGSTPTVLATNLALAVRKIALDSFGNLYISDSTNNVVWFVDDTTGYARTLSGRFGQTGSTTPTFVCNPSLSAVGDGCPGSSSSLFPAADMGAHPDNQGNLYITDAEGGNAALSRIRKQLSGFNFPSTNLATPLTQTVLMHFAVGDTPASAAAFVSNNPAFAVGTVSCTATTGANADGTDDCLVPITFNPVVAGYQTATFTINSAQGGANTYLLTGTGTGPSLAIDPGTLTAFSTTVKNAQGVTADVAGNVYIVDTGNNRVLRSINGGAATAFAGTGVSGYTGDGGLATAATLKAPTAAAVDLTGNVYITDTGNNVIRRVTPNGIISTYAGGGGACAPTANACLATQTSFNAPTGIATDSIGQVYVSDSGNNLIRQISTSGFVFTLAGGGSLNACSHDPKDNPHAIDNQNDGCGALQGIFSSPNGLAYDSIGNFLVVADMTSNIVRKIYLANTIIVTNSSVGTAVVNPLTLVAGNGQAGSSVSGSGAATLSQLNAPRGVAVDAAEDVVIADTGNSAIRFVNNGTGIITTIAGILGTGGAGAVPGSATATSLASPAAVAITAGNNLYIADSGNNRILADNRSQIAYNFGRVNQGTSSPSVVFTETNTGTGTETFPATFNVISGSADFTLTAFSSSVCVNNGTLAAGASCTLNGVFTPSNTGTESATFTQTGALPAGAAPAITLTGIGAVLTKTASTLAQTSPASGNPQFGSSFTVTATVTSSACDPTAPACYPTGTVTFSVDGNTVGAPVPLSTPGSTTAAAATAPQTLSGLSVGPHTAACYYSGDAFYGASSCGVLTLTVTQTGTSSKLVAATSGAPQYPTNNCIDHPANDPDPALRLKTVCVAETLTATIASNLAVISSTPTGTVTFYSGSTVLGTASVNSTGVAPLTLQYITDDVKGTLVSDATLPVGSYSLTCKYNGDANFAASSCAPVAFTVAPQGSTFTLTPRACSVANLYAPGTSIPQIQGPCTSLGTTASGNTDTLLNGYPVAATADGATTDATIFINATNTLSGAITIGCSGLPQYSICTFSPSIASLSTSASYAAPFPIDVTLWTDIRPGNATSALRKPDLGPRHDETHGAQGITLAMLLGWPVTLFGLALVIRSRRRGSRVLPWLAALLVMVGSVTAMTGCGLGGPGVDKVVLTPAGTYPITITVAVGSVTRTTTVYFKVASPGITGQQ